MLEGDVQSAIEWQRSSEDAAEEQSCNCGKNIAHCGWLMLSEKRGIEGIVLEFVSGS